MPVCVRVCAVVEWVRKPVKIGIKDTFAAVFPPCSEASVAFEVCRWPCRLSVPRLTDRERFAS